MCCNNNSGWYTLLIALIIVYFILNRFDGRDYDYDNHDGCDRDHSGDCGNRGGCGCGCLSNGCR